MPKRIIILTLTLVALLTAGCGLGNIPTSAEADLSFSTVQSTAPAPGSPCLNRGGETLAKELINLREMVVVIGGGPDPMPDATWADFAPRLPWQKNLNRFVLFGDSCFYRSPDAPADCSGDACRIDRRYADASWVELSAVISADCFPTPDAGCSMQDGIAPGAFQVTVTRKCHRMVFSGTGYFLTDDRGNRYIMHATESGTPVVDDPALVLPPGWTLEAQPLATPFELLPFGGGDECYYNIGRDNLNQGYHQISFVGATYP